MATSGDLLAPLSPLVFKLGPGDVEEVMRVGGSAFFLASYDAAYWLELLSHRSSVVAFGCKDGATDSLVGFVIVSKDAGAVLPAEERVGSLRALLTHRKPPTLLLCRVNEHSDEAVAFLEANGFTVYLEMPGTVCGADRLYTHMIY
ncbi:hypothetical protein PRIPAC_72481 [Pristionchus pacificus]|uniref:Uncharacterized protein n=1 Tax=Pristionchus pacificus TaxID=54126 RepID=A0A2A6BFP0_PRIPA|nr:hypothetical protein PRIPAC_72481 [Pristionchus pacificus]|eukprot:PDM64700.1 hypothetical protein PRIPAC_52956 [Pristionchus pacificus]